LETTPSSNNRSMHTEYANLLHKRESACVTKYIVREANIKDIYFFQDISVRKKYFLIFLQLLLITVIYCQCCREHDASFSHSNFIRQIQTFQFSLSGPNLMWLSYIKDDLFKNFNKVSQDKFFVRSLKKCKRIYKLWMYEITSFT